MGLEEFLGVMLVALVSLAIQVGLIILGVVIAWRWLRRPGGLADRPRPRAKTAFEILEQRYAQGEIDAAEFEERADMLRRGRG